MARMPWPRSGVRAKLPVVFRRTAEWTPADISGLALWLDGSDTSSLYTTDAGAVTAASSPLDISGCLCWYDAADASSITKDGSNLVSQWNDKSGNGRHATASGSLRPTSGGSQNGRTVMQFTGTQAMTITGNFLQSDNVTMFAVAMKNTDHYGGIITSAPANPEDSPVLTFWLANIAFLNRRVLVQQAVGNSIYRIVSGQSAGTAQQGWFDGARGTDAVASVATNTTNTITKIGALRTSSTADLNGNIAEIICYSGNLTTAQRASVEAYLAAKWGVSGVHAPATTAGDPVGYWRDRSGNGRHATQATGANRPSVTAAGSRRAIAFDGSSDRLLGSHAPVTALPTTLIVAAKPTADNNLATIYGQVSGSSLTSVLYRRFNDGTLNNRFRMYNGGSAGNNLSSVNQWPLNTPAVVGALLASSSSDHRLYYQGVTVPTTGFTETIAPAGAYFLAGDAGRAAANLWAGDIYEVLVYNRSLTTAERQRLERYLANRWGITLAPQVSNADAQDWVNRVYANGGTVSTATASAVNTFCEAIAAANIRDRFYRLNLFAGTGLNACLVPLYRGPSLGGTQYGNTTDTNSGGLFVSGNYVERGASGGLTGNGSTGSKYLNLGTPATLKPSWVTHHFGLDIANGFPDATSRYQMGSFFNEALTSPRGAYSINGSSATIRGDSGTQLRFGFSSASNLKMVIRASANDMRLYEDSGQVSTTNASTDTATVLSAAAFCVMAGGYQNVSAGTPTSVVNGYAPATGTCRGYTIGESMTGEQRLAFVSAWISFQQALERR